MIINPSILVNVEHYQMLYDRTVLTMNMYYFFPLYTDVVSAVPAIYQW